MIALYTNEGVTLSRSIVEGESAAGTCYSKKVVTKQRPSRQSEL